MNTDNTHFRSQVQNNNIEVGGESCRPADFDGKSGDFRVRRPTFEFNRVGAYSILLYDLKRTNGKNPRKTDSIDLDPPT